MVASFIRIRLSDRRKAVLLRRVETAFSSLGPIERAPAMDHTETVLCWIENRRPLGDLKSK